MQRATILALGPALLLTAVAGQAEPVHDLDDDPEGHRDKVMYEFVPPARTARPPPRRRARRTSGTST